MKYSEFVKTINAIDPQFIEITVEKIAGQKAFIHVLVRNKLLVAIGMDDSFDAHWDDDLLREMGDEGKKIFDVSCKLIETDPDERKEVQLYGVRNKDVHDGEYTWIAHDEDEKGYEFHAVNFKNWVPRDFVNGYSQTKFRMPLELAKKHLNAYRVLVKVED